MNTLCRSLCRSLWLVISTLFFVAASAAQGHEIFQDILKEKYSLKSFSCKTCHPSGDDRKLRTPFADLYYEAMKDGDWTEKFALAEAKGKEEVAEFEKVIGEDFKKKLDKVGLASLTVDELFASGLLAGIRIDEKKLKAKQQEQKSETGNRGAQKSGTKNSKLPVNLSRQLISAILGPTLED